MSEKDELKQELFERLETILDIAEFNDDIETGDNAFACIVLAKQLFGDDVDEYYRFYCDSHGFLAKSQDGE